MAARDHTAAKHPAAPQRHPPAAAGAVQSPAHGQYVVPMRRREARERRSWPTRDREGAEAVVVVGQPAFDLALQTSTRTPVPLESPPYLGAGQARPPPRPAKRTGPESSAP